MVLNGNRGLRRGFDVYDDIDVGPGAQLLRRPANEVIDGALDWVNAGRDRPFFLWVHLYDAHAPHALPPEFDGASTADRYAAAIAFMDSQIARLLQALDERQELARTAIIVTADHGESLDDHGERGHGIFVYESALRVPLIVRWPGIEPRRVPDTRPAHRPGAHHPGSRRARHAADGRRQSARRRCCAAARPEKAAGYAESMFPLQYGWSALRTVCATIGSS